jgi:hypothetical protein
MWPSTNHRRSVAPAAQQKDRGARFRREQCGSVGLPTIGKLRRWPGRLADHVGKLRYALIDIAVTGSFSLSMGDQSRNTPHGVDPRKTLILLQRIDRPRH